MSEEKKFNAVQELMAQRKALTDAIIDAVKNDKLHQVPPLQSSINEIDSDARYWVKES